MDYAELRTKLIPFTKTPRDAKKLLMMKSAMETRKSINSSIIPNFQKIAIKEANSELKVNKTTISS